MILNNLIRKLIDLLGGYSDKKVYIELLKHDKESDYKLTKRKIIIHD